MIKNHHYFKILKIQPIKTLQISLKFGNNAYVTILNILSQISESFHLFCFQNFVLSLILMLTCKLFQNFVVLARTLRFWNYTLSVSSLLLNSSSVLIAGLSFLMCSASNVSNLMGACLRPYIIPLRRVRAPLGTIDNWPVKRLLFLKKIRRVLKNSPLEFPNFLHATLNARTNSGLLLPLFDGFIFEMGFGNFCPFPNDHKN